MTKEVAHIHALINPVSGKRVYCQVRAGQPLRKTLNLPDSVICQVNGQPDTGSPLQGGDLVNLMAVPKGDNQGKNIARSSMMIAAAIASRSIFPGDPDLIAGITLGNALGRAAFVTGSFLAVNSLGNLKSTGLKPCPQ